MIAMMLNLFLMFMELNLGPVDFDSWFKKKTFSYRCLKEFSHFFIPLWYKKLQVIHLGCNLVLWFNLIFFCMAT